MKQDQVRMMENERVELYKYPLRKITVHVIIAYWFVLTLIALVIVFWSLLAVIFPDLQPLSQSIVKTLWVMLLLFAAPTIIPFVLLTIVSVIWFILLLFEKVYYYLRPATNMKNSARLGDYQRSFDGHGVKMILSTGKELILDRDKNDKKNNLVMDEWTTKREIKDFFSIIPKAAVIDISIHFIILVLLSPVIAKIIGANQMSINSLFSAVACSLLFWFVVIMCMESQ